MTLNCKNAKDLDVPWSHWFIYGDSGSSKTTIASTFPRPLFIAPENEGSITTLRGMDVPYYTVTGINQPLRHGVGGMVRILDEIEADYNRAPDSFAYDTIVFESLTHYADLAVEEISADGKQMDQQRWGQLWSHLRNLQARIRRLDVHCVLIALAKTDIAEDKTVFGAPLIQGQASLKLPAACDVIAFAEVTSSKNNPQYFLHTRRHRHYIARTRFRRLPDKIENFRFEDIKGFLGADQP